MNAAGRIGIDLGGTKTRLVFVDADGPDALHSFVTTLGRRCGDDPEFTAIYLEYDAELEWPPDDPRLPALAGAVIYYYTKRGILGTILVGMIIYLPLHIGLGW